MVETILKDYPDGDGNPDCKDCLGRGVVPSKVKSAIYVGERTQPCMCVLARDILANVERGWRGLTQAPKIESTRLMGQHGKNLWITMPTSQFRSHLRHIAIRMGPRWNFNVVSDADLMDSWLARVDDDDVYDGDVHNMRQAPVTSKYGALVDLVEPPELLILITGVKAARNSAMPEVLLEALLHRNHINKPTWIIDNPDARLASGHISYDGHVGNFLRTWPHVNLTDKKAQPRMILPATGIHRMSLSTAEAEAIDEVGNVEQPVKAPMRPQVKVPVSAPAPVIEELEEEEQEETQQVRTHTTMRSEFESIPTESKKKKQWGRS